ncbi:interferon a3-like [Sphaeramia orbicularis]|uniref:interferon a3-like n=1 Tax=Sphaeramia orbicularis TaxID=375764 RepID=UPI00117DE852|nr:interferon a3-like [Sphaeramia orbicularis]
MFTWTWTRTWTWTAVLVFLFSNTLTSALRCDWLKHYGHRSNECLNLLEDMGGQLIQEDGRDRCPYRLYSRIRNTQVESQVVFIRDSLEHILRLYDHGNRSSVTWDTVNTEHFLLCLRSQIDKLNGCVLTSNRTNHSLRKYYKRLSKEVLDRTGSSAESWELIRKNTKEHLEQLHLLVNSIRHQQEAEHRGHQGAEHSHRTRDKHINGTATTITTATITTMKERSTAEEQQ